MAYTHDDHETANALGDTLAAVEKERPKVTVMVLETGKEMTFVDISIRRALVAAWRQEEFNDYNFWDYDKYLGKVQVSKSGKTAAIFGKTCTVSAVL